MSGKPITLPARHVINIVLGLALIFFIYGFFVSQSAVDFWLIVGISLALGILAHHPDRRRRHAGRHLDAQFLFGLGGRRHRFTLGTPRSSSPGAGRSSGAILSYIMCNAMNRSFVSVILGGFGGEVAGPASGAEQRPVKLGSAEDAAYIMKNAQKVIIVAGYGMAVAQAQHALREMADKLKKEGVEVNTPSIRSPAACRPHERAARRS